MDRPIQRKSKTYIEQEIAAGRADWVDPSEPRKGIICREMLYFGERTFVPENTGSSLPAEIPGLKFVPPKMDKNPTLPHLELASIRLAATIWDWSCEPAV